MNQLIDLVELFKIIILSIVQGITEWLPISSTGHMIILEDFLSLNLRSEFIEFFFVLVQLGSIFAVIILYFSKLNPFSPKKSTEQQKQTWILWFKVAFASIPVAIIGAALNDYVDEYLYNPLVVAAALIIYGILFIVIENRQQGRHRRQIRTFNELSFPRAFKIGIYQSLSIIPGTSRSGSTIIGGLLEGASRSLATEFSFFLSIPAMFGASLYKFMKLNITLTSSEWIYLLVGMFVAFIVSIIAIKFLLAYIKNNDFKAFGIYRIILGTLVIAYWIVTR